MMFQDFVVLVTRDQTEEILLTYLPVLRSWLQARGSWEMLCCILPALMEDGADFALTNKVGNERMNAVLGDVRISQFQFRQEQYRLYLHIFFLQ